MSRRFISHKAPTDKPLAYDIIVLKGKVYEFSKEGCGKQIQTYDIINVGLTTKESEDEYKQGKSLERIFEIETTEPLKCASLSTSEEINQDINNLENIITQLKCHLKELEKKHKNLKNLKIGSNISFDRNSLPSDELSVSMPLLSPQQQRYSNCELILEKLDNSTILNGSVQKKTKKNLKAFTDINSSVNNLNTSMPKLSPYYTIPVGFFSKQNKIKKNVKNSDEQSSVLKPKLGQGLPSFLSLTSIPVVHIVPLSKSVLAKYSLNYPNKTLKRKLSDDHCFAKKRAIENISNSSSEFIDSPRIKISGAKSKKRKNVESVQNKKKCLSQKTDASKKSKRINKKKKSVIAPKKKLKMSSSLWMQSSSCSSLESSSILSNDSFTTVKGKLTTNTILESPSKNSTASVRLIKVGSSKCIDIEPYLLSDSDILENESVNQSQNITSPINLKTSETEFLTPNQSPSSTASVYHTPPFTKDVLNKS